VSHGILQHAVSGKVALQLAYANPENDSRDRQANNDYFQNQVNQSLDDEFASILQLI
jgi:hypothetical protein